MLISSWKYSLSYERQITGVSLSKIHIFGELGKFYKAASERET